MTCRKCGSSLDASRLWCLNCGTWAGQIRPLCDCNLNNEAVGLCALCGIPVCGTCGSVDGARVLCKDPSHASLLESQRVVARLNSVFEADWLSANLKSRGIDAMVFSNDRHPGFLGVSGHTDVRLLVSSEKVDEAKEMLRSFEVEAESMQQDSKNTRQTANGRED